MNKESLSDRIVNVASVVLISIAAILTALCTAQSGRWDGQQARLYNLANADRTHSSEASDRADVLTAIDVGLFLQYVTALHSHDTTMSDFIDRRFRPEMQRAMRAWLASHPLQNSRAPSSPFVMREYRLKTREEAKTYEDQARKHFTEAVTANKHADEFLVLTVIFAGVSFLAGVSTKMKYPRHAIVVTLAFLATIYGVVQLISTPFL